MLLSITSRVHIISHHPYPCIHIPYPYPYRYPVLLATLLFSRGYHTSIPKLCISLFYRAYFPRIKFFNEKSCAALGARGRGFGGAISASASHGLTWSLESYQAAQRWGSVYYIGTSFVVLPDHCIFPRIHTPLAMARRSPFHEIRKSRARSESDWVLKRSLALTQRLNETNQSQLFGRQVLKW